MKTFCSDITHKQVNTTKQKQKPWFAGNGRLFLPSELYEGAGLGYNVGKEVKCLSCNGSNGDIGFYFCWVCCTWRKQELFITSWYAFHCFLFCLVFLNLLWCLCPVLYPAFNEHSPSAIGWGSSEADATVWFLVFAFSCKDMKWNGCEGEAQVV